jgi:flavin-dependent dehydrogenase
MGRYDVAVIGAGPAGLLTSLYIRDREVIIFEEHDTVGKPEHCTGLIGLNTTLFFTRLLSWRIIDNKYYGIYFHTPIGNYKLFFKEPIAYHVNRPMLEEKLLDRVNKRGHHVIFNMRVKPLQKPGSFRASGRSFQVEKIIAAEGPLSLFRKIFYDSIHEKLYGIQMLIRSRALDTNYFHVVYDEYIPEFFGWVVPLDHDLMLTGYAVSQHRIHPYKLIDRMIRRTGYFRGSVVKSFGGIIPVDKPLGEPSINNKVFFVGDSIPFTKTYTGGGLYGIALYAPILGSAINYGKYDLLRKYFRLLRKYFLNEYRVTNIFRSIGYWIPPVIVEFLHRYGLVNPHDYDEHYRLIHKVLPLIPYISIKILLKQLIRTLTKNTTY